MSNDLPLWAATEADGHGWERNPRRIMAVAESDRYIVNEAWLLRKKVAITNKYVAESHTLPKIGFLSEMNIATGRRYRLYRECFWCQSTQEMGYIPVYLFEHEEHADAFLSKIRERSASHKSYLETAPELASDEPYRVLGVSRKATRKEIKQVFREKARRLHPDAGGDPDKFSSLVEAFNALMAR